jgi:PadR family transcriptional regulator PadR
MRFQQAVLAGEGLPCRGWGLWWVEWILQNLQGLTRNVLYLQVAIRYVFIRHMVLPVFDRELKKGSAELLILSLLEHRARHGYEISKLIEDRSDGLLKFNVASLYPMLYRLEGRELIAGRWVEKAGQRRRRYYRLTTAGKDVLKSQRANWLGFVTAIQRITEAENA